MPWDNRAVQSDAIADHGEGTWHVIDANLVDNQ